MKNLLLTMVLAGSVVSHAAPTYFVNGKEVNASEALLAGMDSKNKVLKCEQQVTKVNSKGSAALKKSDSTGDWTPVSKK